jgi:hypothetical protein
MDANFKHDVRAKRNGWAPGDYLCACQSCGCRFIGDKRARQCADCAYAIEESLHDAIKEEPMSKHDEVLAKIELLVRRTVSEMVKRGYGGEAIAGMKILAEQISSEILDGRKSKELPGREI